VVFFLDLNWLHTQQLRLSLLSHCDVMAGL
jgi:hypothetical protein